MSDDRDFDTTKITDKIGIVSVGEWERDVDEERATTVSVQELKRGVDMLDTLGWSQVDLMLLPPKYCDADDVNTSLPIFRPTPNAMFADSDAAVAIAPRTKQGREREVL